MVSVPWRCPGKALAATQRAIIRPPGTVTPEQRTAISHVVASTCASPCCHTSKYTARTKGGVRRPAEWTFGAAMLRHY